MDITFFSQGHNGDIHYSRGFIKAIMEDVSKVSPNTKFYYMNKMPKELILDIENLVHVPWAPQIDPLVFNRLFVASSNQGQTVMVNTWIGCHSPEGNDDYTHPEGISFLSNMKLYRDAYKDIENYLGVVLDCDLSEDRVLPSIDYGYYQTDLIQDHLTKTKDATKKRIFISNGPVFSGQAPNFDFDVVLDDIIPKFPEHTFYLTDHKSSLTERFPNAICTRDIIGLDGCDLNENSFLSTKCDIIVGRASGPYTFAHTHDNYMNEKKTLHAISHSRDDGEWFSTGRANYVWTPTHPDHGWDNNEKNFKELKDTIIDYCEN
ncbi:MAG: hypothetical protein HOJ16_00015 [Candidatus Peribacter sp.]|mgnify:CR=1 FL=1|jgi:hypothetical protein|nr:hypothetical protein [Candidatus Peribacter sp.]